MRGLFSKKITKTNVAIHLEVQLLTTDRRFINYNCLVGKITFYDKKNCTVEFDNGLIGLIPMNYLYQHASLSHRQKIIEEIIGNLTYRYLVDKNPPHATKNLL